MTNLKLLAPAKINLHLRVGGRRNDGFHPLLTWMTTIGLFDTLSLNSFPVSSHERILLTCDDPNLPCDGRNLVFRAAEMFARESGSTESVSIHLEKRTPSGGGLGGGSSDAAFTLLGLNQLLNQKISLGHLSEMAAKLGSDVPFFLYGPSSICKGRGEEVKPVGVLTGDQWVTLVTPPIGMPTADVYRRFDEMGLGRDLDLADPKQEPVWSEWASSDARSLLPRLVNDLETPAFAIRPELGELLAAIEKKLGRPVRMSGSGSSLFTLFDDKEEADRAAKQITIDFGVKAFAIELCPKIDTE